MGSTADGLPILQAGAAAVRQAWQEVERQGRPRIMTGRYFSLGANADTVGVGADEFIRHYSGDAGLPVARADTLTTTGRFRAELAALRAAGATDVMLYPCSAGLEQIDLLSEALTSVGFSPGRTCQAPT